MAGTEYIDHLVVGQITFKNGSAVVAPAAGVPGLPTLPVGTKQPLAAAQTAPATTSGTAGATYTSAEQTIINNLVAQVNALTAALKTTGQLK